MVLKYSVDGDGAVFSVRGSARQWVPFSEDQQQARGLWCVPWGQRWDPGGVGSSRVSQAQWKASLQITE